MERHAEREREREREREKGLCSDSADRSLRNVCIGPVWGTGGITQAGWAIGMPEARIISLPIPPAVSQTALPSSQAW